MKQAVLGALLGAGLMAAAVGARDQGSQVFAQRLTAPQAVSVPTSPAASVGSELVVVPTPLGDKGQLLTVIDPRQQVMGVYHIELASGKITLRSVRNLHWDLSPQMTYLNNDPPLPQEIRALSEQK